MRKLIPVRDSVVCRKISGGDAETVVNGLKVKTQTVDEYEILHLPLIEPENSMFKVGDVVMSNSTGDEIEINHGDTVYLFKLENIMCRIDG